MPTRGKKDPNGRALRGRRAYTTFISDPIAQIWSNYNVRSGAAGAATPEQPAVQNCLYDRFEALYKKSSIKPSLVIVPARFKSGTLYSEIPTSGAGDFTVTRATAATRVNASGFIESVASGIPRLDYFASGGTVGCPALLVEPAATNSIRNNSMIGAVTGSPGTLPTGGGWSNSLIGLTQTVVDFGTENGISYLDIRFSGTATSTNSAELRYESTTQIVASSGQTWSHSVYLKKIAEPNPPNNYQLNIYERTDVGGYVANGVSTIVPTTTIQRFSQTRTLSGATTARVQPNLFFGLTSGSTYNFTVRIGYPQMETGSVATSVIPTTTGSVTRNADVVSVSGAVSGSIGQTAGTIYYEFAYFGQPVIRSGPIYLRQAGSRGLSINYSPSDSPLGIAFISRNDGGSTLLNIVSGALQIGTYYKIAIGYDAAGTAAGGSQASGVVAYVNGVQTAIGTFRVPDAAGLTEFRMYGANSGTDAEIFNGRIRAAEVYPTRLPNVAPPGVLSLQSLTTL